MRWGFVGLLLCVCACDSRYGAYFVVKSDVEFDAVELYFGTPISSSGPGSGDAFATPTLGAQRGTIFDRTFADADVMTVGTTTETTFYIPPTETNQQLGAYVAAVASSGGHPVGVAEYFGFEVPSDVVHEYKLKLAPWNPQEAEQWGDAPGCLVWKHPRDGGEPLVAVVHDDDRDCDTMATSVDCNDLCSAQSPACAADQLLCTGAGYCALGCAGDGVCMPSLCLPPSTCTSLCTSRPTLQGRLACGAANTNGHLEIFVERTDTKQMCTTMLSFKPGLPCAMPKVEAADGLPPGISFTISPLTGDTQTCVLTATQTATAVLEDLTRIHLLISFAAPANVGPRVTIVVGVQAQPNGMGCATQPQYTTVAPTTQPVYNCTMM